MTSLTIDHLDPPSTVRRMRAVEAVRWRALDELSGRTVWCASALPGRSASARRLRASLQWGGGGGLRSGVLEVDADERLRHLAQRLEAMLEGASPSRLGDAERELCAEGVRGSEDLVGAVSPDDVVVVHDALTALLAEALRERGAHAVWHVELPADAQPPGRCRGTELPAPLYLAYGRLRHDVVAVRSPSPRRRRAHRRAHALDRRRRRQGHSGGLRRWRAPPARLEHRPSGRRPRRPRGDRRRHAPRAAEGSGALSRASRLAVGPCDAARPTAHPPGARRSDEPAGGGLANAAVRCISAPPLRPSERVLRKTRGS